MSYRDDLFQSKNYVGEAITENNGDQINSSIYVSSNGTVGEVIHNAEDGKYKGRQLIANKEVLKGIKEVINKKQPPEIRHKPAKIAPGLFFTKDHKPGINFIWNNRDIQVKKYPNPTPVEIERLKSEVKKIKETLD